MSTVSRPGGGISSRNRLLWNRQYESCPAPAQRTLPAEAVLLQFYLLPDGTAVADFSDALANATPSGIMSEQMAVDSIVRTLQANISSAHRLKILIHGQEVDTLAGHLDLTQFFPLSPPEPAPSPTADAAAPQ